jgi:methylglutaconyl-CoA hydratase
MDLNTIEFSMKEQVAYLWLDRPEKRNALNAEMLGELISILRTISDNGEARILVLRGKGKVFCAGADLEFMSDIAGKSDEDLKEEAALFFDCFESLYRLPIPVICFAHGAVHGGANGLLAASDFVLSTVLTRFSFSEVSLGLVPATVAPFVLRRMGAVRARQCMISGEIMDGNEAYSSGLVDHLLTQEQAEEEIGTLIGLLKQNAPDAVKVTKRLLADLENLPETADLKAKTTDIIARVRRGAEAREGLDAFFTRRIPNWQIKE